jgi:hypothetical protein
VDRSWSAALPGRIGRNGRSGKGRRQGNWRSGRAYLSEHRRPGRRQRGLAVGVVAGPAAPAHRDPQRRAAAGPGGPGRGDRPGRRTAGAGRRPAPTEHLPDPAAADGHHRAPARRPPASAGHAARRRRAAGIGRPGPPEPPASPPGRARGRGLGAVPDRRRDPGRPGPGWVGSGGTAAGGSGAQGGSSPPVTTTPVDDAAPASVRVPPVGVRVRPPRSSAATSPRCGWRRLRWSSTRPSPSRYHPTGW